MAAAAVPRRRHDPGLASVAAAVARDALVCRPSRARGLRVVVHAASLRRRRCEGVAATAARRRDVAQTKVSQVIEYSRKNDQPLMSVVREVIL